MSNRREYPSAPIPGVGAVVFHEDCVLLVQRNREPRLGQWSLPGGAVELGETLEEAVIREVREETGLTVTPISHVKALERIERDRDDRVRFHYVLNDFLCRVLDPGSRLHPATDVSDARWVPLANLRQSNEYLLPIPTLEVIDVALRLAAHKDRSLKTSEFI